VQETLEARSGPVLLGCRGCFFFHTKKNKKKREREPSVEAVIDLCQNRFGKPYSAFLCLCSGEHQMFPFKACFCSDVQCSNCFSLCSQVLVNQRNTNSYVCENCCSVPRKWVGNGLVIQQNFPTYYFQYICARRGRLTTLGSIVLLLALFK